MSAYYRFPDSLRGKRGDIIANCSSEDKSIDQVETVGRIDREALVQKEKNPGCKAIYQILNGNYDSLFRNRAEGNFIYSFFEKHAQAV